MLPGNATEECSSTGRSRRCFVRRAATRFGSVAGTYVNEREAIPRKGFIKELDNFTVLRNSTPADGRGEYPRDVIKQLARNYLFLTFLFVRGRKAIKRSVVIVGRLLNAGASLWIGNESVEYPTDRSIKPDDGSSAFELRDVFGIADPLERNKYVESGANVNIRENDRKIGALGPARTAPRRFITTENVCCCQCRGCFCAESIGNKLNAKIARD